MQQIAIVGAGFTGSMTGVNLVRESNLPFKLLMIDKKQKFNRGTAYDSYSSLHLLNVRAFNMSAFPDDPEHFVNWLKNSKGYCRFEKEHIGPLFIPKNIYGKYLKSIWKDTLKQARGKGIQIKQIDGLATQLQILKYGISLKINHTRRIFADTCIIAVGNHLPRNIEIENVSFYGSKSYFRDPWNIAAVNNVDNSAYL